MIRVCCFVCELQLWEQLKDQVVAPQHPLYTRIVENTNRIVKANQDLEFFRKQTWTVIVVDSAEGNAFVLPVRRQPDIPAAGNKLKPSICCNFLACQQQMIRKV